MNWNPPKKLPLVHTELAGDDMIWLPQGMQEARGGKGSAGNPCVALIDIGAMRHTHPGYDLETVSRFLNSKGRAKHVNKDRDLVECMMNSYWDHLHDKDARERYEADRSLALALYAIPRWSTRIKSAARDPPGGVERGLS
jgi:hypothetical protein